MSKTYFYWDPTEDNIVREYDDAGTVTAEYTTEPELYGNVISQRRQGEYRQFQYDAQGSTLAATDENENVTDTFAYTAFGEVTERTGTTVVPLQYVGRQGYYTDGLTGQIIARRRPYEPVRARWLSCDPLRQVNPYLYVDNAPLNYFDPFGLSPACVTPNGVTYVAGRGSFREIWNGTLEQWDARISETIDWSKWLGHVIYLRWLPRAATFWRDEQNCCCCDEIGFLQVKKATFDWAHVGSMSEPFQTDVNFEIDRYWYQSPLGGIPYQAGLTGRFIPPKTTDPCTTGSMISFWDRPFTAKFNPGFWSNLKHWRIAFEVCVMCVSGTEGYSTWWTSEANYNSITTTTGLNIVVYDCVEWEVEFKRQKNGTYKGGGKVTKRGGPPGARFREGVTWESTAAGTRPH